MSRRGVWLGASACFLVALGLRLWGIGFGLPDLYHPDEPAYVLQALAVGRGLPDGLTFANPPLYKYVLLVEYAATFVVQRLIGAAQSPQDFIVQFRGDPGPLYLLARVTSATFGAATSLAALALGTTVGGRRVGIIAGVLTAITYALVRDAHFGVNDAFVTLLVTLGLVYCVRVSSGGSRRDYLSAGALAGLAFAAKYHGIALLAPLVLAHVLRAGGRRHVDLAIALGACGIASVVAFPSLVTETTRVIADVYLHLYVGATSGYDGLDPAGGYVSYAKALAVGLGWPLLTLVAAGLILGLVRRDRSLIVVGSLPLVIIGVLGAQQMYFARFLLPALPALVIEAAVAVDSLIIVRPVLGVALAMVAAVPTLADAVRFDVLLTRADTRTLARNWIDASVPANAQVALDSAPLGPALSAERHQALVADEFSLFDLSLADYRQRGVEYLVTSTFTSAARAINPARDGRRTAFYAELEGNADLVAQFRPFSGDTGPPFVYDQIYGPFDSLGMLERPGPTVTVYRLSAGADTPP